MQVCDTISGASAGTHVFNTFQVMKRPKDSRKELSLHGAALHTMIDHVSGIAWVLEQDPPFLPASRGDGFSGEASRSNDTTRLRGNIKWWLNLAQPRLMVRLTAHTTGSGWFEQNVLRSLPRTAITLVKGRDGDLFRSIRYAFNSCERALECLAKGKVGQSLWRGEQSI